MIVQNMLFLVTGPRQGPRDLDRTLAPKSIQRVRLLGMIVRACFHNPFSNIHQIFFNIEILLIKRP